MVTWEIITLFLVNYNSTQIQMMGTHLQGPLPCKYLFREISPLLGRLPQTQRPISPPSQFAEEASPLLTLALRFPISSQHFQPGEGGDLIHKHRNILLYIHPVNGWDSQPISWCSWGTAWCSEAPHHLKLFYF